MAIFKKRNPRPSQAPRTPTKGKSQLMITAKKVISFIDVELAKKSFLVLAAASLILIPIDAVWIYSRHPRPPKISPTMEKKEMLSQSESAYLAILDKSALLGGSASGVSPAAFQASAAELIKDYRLKGVVLGGEPEAIVEDAKTQKTMFIKKGEKLGSLTVQEIHEGFILLGYSGGQAKLEIQ